MVGGKDEWKKNTATSINSGILKVYTLIERRGILIIGPFFLIAIIRLLIEPFIEDISKNSLLEIGAIIVVIYGYSASKF